MTSPRGLVMTVYCDMSGSDVARAGHHKPRTIKWAAADPLYSLYDASHPSQQGHSGRDIFPAGILSTFHTF